VALQAATGACVVGVLWGAVARLCRLSCAMARHRGLTLFGLSRGFNTPFPVHPVGAAYDYRCRNIPTESTSYMSLVDAGHVRQGAPALW
jgi:hypothetical protein